MGWRGWQTMPCQGPGAAAAAVLLVLALMGGSSTPAAAGPTGNAGFDGSGLPVNRALRDPLAVPPEGLDLAGDLEEEFIVGQTGRRLLASQVDLLALLNPDIRQAFFSLPLDIQEQILSGELQEPEPPVYSTGEQFGRPWKELEDPSVQKLHPPSFGYQTKAIVSAASANASSLTPAATAGGCPAGQVGDSNQNCQNMGCVTCFDAFNFSFSFKIRLPDPAAPLDRSRDTVVDLGDYISPATIINEFLGFIGKTLCTLAFRGQDLLEGTWVNRITGVSSDVATKLGTLIPLFNAMPLSNTSSYFAFGFPVGVPPKKGKDGASPTVLQKIAGVLGTGVGIAFNPCTKDIFFQFYGLKAGPIPIGAGLGVSLEANVFGFSMNGQISSDVKGLELNRNFWLTRLNKVNGQIKEFDNIPADGPLLGHLFFQGQASIEPVSPVSKYFSFGIDGVIKLLLNYDALGNGNTGNTAGDFRVLLTCDVAPYITLGPDGLIPINLTKLFQASTNIYIGNAQDGFRMAIGMKVTTGGLGDVLSQIPGFPDAAKKVLNALFSAASPPVKEANVYGSEQAWGIRVVLGMPGAFNRIKDLLGDIADLLGNVPGLSGILRANIEAEFAIMGATTGNGLPIGLTFGLGSLGRRTFYFCNANSQCPSGSTCYGILCVTAFGCPSGYSREFGVTCMRNCDAGYEQVVKVGCMRNCDNQKAGSNPSYYNAAAECLQNCKSDYSTGWPGGYCQYNGGRKRIRVRKPHCSGEYTWVGLWCEPNKYFKDREWRQTYARDTKFVTFGLPA